jgi:four helix bundle protein
MRDFKKLLIWQNGMDIVDKAYDVLPSLPLEEKFGLKVQLAKCAVSIHSNIAEGSAKRSEKDYLRYIEISLGSSFELETQLIVVRKRKWPMEQKIDELLDLVHREQKMISKFIDKL